MPLPTTRTAGTAQRINTGIFLSSNDCSRQGNGKKWQTFRLVRNGHANGEFIAAPHAAAKENAMKKLLVLALVFGFATAGLVGCGGSSATTTETSTTTKS